MKIKNRGVVLAAATVALFFFGFLYSWSIFKTAMLPELGWDAGEISWAYTFAMIAFSLGILIQGLIPVKSNKTMRLLVAIATVVAGGGMMLCATITEQWQLYLYYGLLFGLGIGFLYNAWIAMVMRWFADKGGFATGILLMGFGVTTFVFSFFSDVFLGEGAYLGWRGTFLVLGIVLVVVGLAAIPFFTRPQGDTIKKTVKNMPKYSLTPGQMLRESSFWEYTIWKMIGKLIGISVAGYATTLAVVLFLGQNPGETADTINQVIVNTPFGRGSALKMAAICGSLFSVGNGFGRVPMGVLHDKLGAFKTLVFICLMNLAGSVLTIVSFQMQTFLLLAFSMLVLGFAYAGVAMEGPAFMNEIYGNRHVGANMGINAITTIPPIIIGSKIIASVYAKTGGFQEFFIITIILSVVSLVATFFIPLSLKKMDKKYGA